MLTGLSAPLLRLALPVGISFYTFQILSYTVDVYRGTVPAQRNFIDLAAYIAMFPQLIAGPIVRYSDIAVQLKTREHSVSEAASGARRFILGLAKKILLANLLGELVSSFRASADLSVLYYWLGAIAFTLQIYYDFSGYSDMAIGLGRIFGFRFPENFQYPYLSGSITEFWRRWHISLGSWFRDYLYIPLGGNRKGSARQLLNILLVWLATGLWHGAAWNFVLWGLLYAVLLTAEKLFLLRGLQKLHVLNHVYVLLFVTLGFVLFDASSVQDAAQSIRAMFGGGRYDNLVGLFVKNAKISGVGYGMGDVTLENFLVTHNLMPDPSADAVKVLVTRFDDVPYEAYLSLVSDLHRAGIPATLFLGSKKYGKQLEYALKGGFTHVITMGGDELSRGVLHLKNLSTREELELPATAAAVAEKV